MRRCARSWAARRARRRSSTARAPDTGNMEVLVRYGTAGAEGAVAGAAAGRRDPLGLRDDRAGRSPRPTPPTSRPRIRRDGDDYVINGRKWWTSGATDPRCQIFIVMGKTDPDAPTPPAAVDDPGAAAHARRAWSSACCRSSATTTRRTATPRSIFDDVRVPAANMLLGEGRGFEIAQGRLGPGRIHHCMRLIGLAERALERMCRRAQDARRLRHAARRADA